MFIHVDHHNGLAVYEQIVRQVKFSIADGAIRATELVPSVRELARELAINPNTVARAYRELQSENLLTAVRGTGLAVTATARKRCQADRKQMIQERVRQVIDEAIHSGLDAEQIDLLVAAEMKRVKSKALS